MDRREQGVFNCGKTFQLYVERVDDIQVRVASYNAQITFCRQSVGFDKVTRFLVRKRADTPFECLEKQKTECWSLLIYYRPGVETEKNRELAEFLEFKLLEIFRETVKFFREKEKIVREHSFYEI